MWFFMLPWVTNIYYPANIMGHPELKIVRGSTDGVFVAFEINIPYGVNIEAVYINGNTDQQVYSPTEHSE